MSTSANGGSSVSYLVGARVGCCASVGTHCCDTVYISSQVGMLEMVADEIRDAILDLQLPSDFTISEGSLESEWGDGK